MSFFELWPALVLLLCAILSSVLDIWSLGVILYMLVCGAAPFQEANDSETLTMIMDCNYIVSMVSRLVLSLTPFLCRYLLTSPSSAKT